MAATRAWPRELYTTTKLHELTKPRRVRQQTLMRGIDTPKATASLCPRAASGALLLSRPQPGVRVGQLDVQLCGTLHNLLALLRRHVARHLGAVFAARTGARVQWCVSTKGGGGTARVWLQQQLLVLRTHRLCMSSRLRSLTLWTMYFKKPLGSRCLVFLLDP